jgi:hypothetical protein
MTRMTHLSSCFRWLFFSRPHRFAVRRVLDEPTLTCTFMDDVAIEAFWHQPDHERVATWGNRLDLDLIL